MSSGRTGTEISTRGANLLSVMSVNIRVNASVDGVNRWPLRASALAGQIRGYAPDLWGAQEVRPEQWEDLRRALPEYESVGLGREADGGGEASPVFYRSSRFTLMDAGTFWLSATPAVPGSLGWDADLPRVATWTVLRDRASGRELAMVNTHFDHAGEQARREAAKLMVARLAELGADRPVILTGDLNATPESEPVRTLEQAGFTRAETESATRSGPAHTFHGFGTLPLPERPWIDYVFYRGPIVGVVCRVADEPVNGRWTSDHFPLLAVLAWTD